MKICVDAGGTNVRIAYVDDSHQIIMKEKYRIDSFPGNDQGCHSAINKFLSDAQGEIELKSINSIVISAAGYLTENRDSVQFTNADWRVSINDLIEKFEGTFSPTINGLLLNDFEALSYGLSKIEANDIDIIFGRQGHGDTKIVCGPGTGLGFSALKETVKGQLIVIPSEGGHQSFPAETSIEQDISNELMQNFLSYEDILSGKGLQRLYTFFCCLIGKKNPFDLSPKKILLLYENGDEAAGKALEEFSYALGTFCGNMALAIGATKGIYLWGGIIKEFPISLLKTQMMNRFHNRGKMAAYVADIPVYRIISEDIALRGCSIYASIIDNSNSSYQ